MRMPGVVRNAIIGPIHQVKKPICGQSQWLIVPKYKSQHQRPPNDARIMAPTYTTTNGILRNDLIACLVQKYERNGVSELHVLLGFGQPPSGRFLEISF